MQKYSPKMFNTSQTNTRKGFTLIELSIVLVIIGLITGSILVGQDLIKSAETRSQIAQIEKYNAAVNAFQNKYGGLPGDLSLSTANLFGFNSGSHCDGSTGKRNGDGIITGYAGDLGSVTGEAGLFWQDLSTAGYIDGVFPNSGASYVDCAAASTINLSPGTAYIGDYFPTGKIGHATFLYVYNSQVSGGANYNWFGLSAVTGVGGSYGSEVTSGTGIPVNQAYSIDKKMDDGLPTSGSVQAVYVNGSATTLQNANAQATDSTTSCYNTTSSTYSVGSTAKGGALGNCALSFQFN